MKRRKGGRSGKPAGPPPSRTPQPSGSSFSSATHGQPTGPGPMPASLPHRTWLLGLLLVIVTLIAYGPLWRAGFVWDDDTLLTGNAAVKSADGLRHIWFQTDFPLTLTSFWLEWRLWGMNAAGYHITNVLLHAVGSLLLWRVLVKLKIPAAWLMAACFAVHPVNVESVAWIAERKNTLALVFYGLALLAYLTFEDTGRWRSYWIALGAFTLALLSKTAVAPLPLVLLGVAWWRRRRVQPMDVWRTLPFFAIAAVLSLMSVWFQNQVGSQGVRMEGFWSRLAGAGWVTWFYLYKALLPLNLIFVYPRWQIDPAHFQSYLPVMLLAVAILIGWKYRRGWGRPWLFGLGYFVVMLLPVLGFVNVYFMRYSLVADHYQYFALIGPLALAVAALAWLADQLGKGAPWSRPVLSGLLLFLLGTLTWRQCRIYSNTDTLWQATLERNPQCDMAYNNLGADFLARGRVDEAIVYYQKSLALMPDDVAYGNLGYALLKKGRLDEAIEDLSKAVEIRPDFAEAHFNLGIALDKKGRTEEAIDHLQSASKFLPADPEVQKALANALMQRGQLDPAIECYQKALAIRPIDAQCLNNLGVALTKKGRPDEAIACYQKALAIEPGYATAHECLANALLRKGQLDEAIVHYRKALAIEPTAAQVHNSLGLALMQQGNLDAAIVQYQQALESQPWDGDALGNLADALLLKRQPDQAIVLYQKMLEIAPGNASVLGNLGNALLMKGRVDEAMARFQEAIKIEPRNVNAHLNLGNALVREHRLSEAIVEYNQALTIDPDHLPSLNRLARILATSAEASFRNGPRAVELTQHADRLSNGHDPASAGLLGAAYAETGKFPEAIASVQRALALLPRNNTNQSKVFQSQLALYEAGTPFHDASLTNAATAPVRP